MNRLMKWITTAVILASFDWHFGRAKRKVKPKRAPNNKAMTPPENK